LSGFLYGFFQETLGYCTFLHNPVCAWNTARVCDRRKHDNCDSSFASFGAFAIRFETITTRVLMRTMTPALTVRDRPNTVRKTAEKMQWSERCERYERWLS